MTRTHAVLALGLVLVLSACAQRGDAGGTPPPASPGLDLPDDADALVLQVAWTGGSVPAGLPSGQRPVLSVYADGRVLSEGPVIAIYPGPAWPNVQVQQVDPATVQTLVQHAFAAGIGDTTDLGSPDTADVVTTRFTVTTATGTTVREVAALLEGAGALTADQQAARAALTDLFTELTDLPATLGDQPPAAYEPTAVAVLARPWTAPDDPFLGDRPDVPWPGPALPGEPVGPDLGCALATGDQVRAVVDAARAADQLTPWTTGDGARWAISFRPLLPHETGCADLTR